MWSECDMILWSVFARSTSQPLIDPSPCDLLRGEIDLAEAATVCSPAARQSDAGASLSAPKIPEKLHFKDQTLVLSHFVYERGDKNQVLEEQL